MTCKTTRGDSLADAQREARQEMTIKINRQSERGGPGLRLLAVCGNDFGIRRLGGKTTFAVHPPSRVLVLTIPPAPVKRGTQTGAASTQGCANRDIRPSVALVHLTRLGVVISACQMTHHHDNPKARQQTPASKAQDLVAASRESICLNRLPGSDRNRATAGCRRCHLVEDLGGFVEKVEQRNRGFPGGRADILVQNTCKAKYDSAHVVLARILSFYKDSFGAELGWLADWTGRQLSAACCPWI